MSGHNPCTCKGSRKERIKRWYVSQRNYNVSHFEKPKGERHYSDYSTVMCIGCNMVIRSKAKYVDDLPDNRPTEETKGCFYKKM